MDPITAAITAALAPTLTDVAREGIKDAYEALKAVIRRMWGQSAPISKAIAAIEEDPTSKAQAAVLQEKVGAVNATDDPEVAQALTQLVDRMKAHDIGREAAATIQVSMSGQVGQGI